MKGTAAEMGARLYSHESQEWKLIEEYRDLYRGRYVVQEGGLLNLAREGRWQPDELRTLRWWAEIDTEAGQIGSIYLPRG